MFVHGAVGSSTIKSGNYNLKILYADKSGGLDLNMKVIPKVCGTLKGNDWAQLKGYWKHLRDLPIKGDNSPVEILLGLDAGMLIEPREAIRGNPSEPYALRTLLGWICRGKTDPRIELGLETESRVNHAMVEVPLNEAVSQFYHTESYGAEGKEVEGPSFSIQDQYALKLIKEGTKRLESQTGYEVSLPWIPWRSKTME
jgi:hypothetical protein